MTRLAAVLAMAWLLVPASCGDGCSLMKDVAAYRVEGDCGPTGIIVFEQDGRGWVVVHNSAILGLPNGVARAGSSGVCFYGGAAAGWSVSGSRCENDASPCEQRTCGIVRAPSPSVVCTSAGRVTCKSKLTVLP